MPHLIVSPNGEATRNEAWLNAQLEAIWRNHFSDVNRANTVTIRWGRRSRTRLGTITGKGGINPREYPEVSEIRVNPLLQHPSVPECVVWQTIAHEVAHYTHGFCSPHPQKYAHPHQGNIIAKELYARNFGAIYNDAQAWLTNHWAAYMTQSLGTTIRKRRKPNAQRRVSLLSHFKQAVARRRRLGK